MTFEKAEEKYKAQREKLLAFEYVDFITSWDAMTLAPEGSFELEAPVQSTIASMSYALHTDPDFAEAVEVLCEHAQELDEVLAHEVKEVRRNIREMQKIPKEEYAAFQELISACYPVYVEAKRGNNFEAFRPYLERIVDYERKLTHWLETEDRHGYDVLLDRYEPEMTTAEYDRFFDVLRARLVPFAKEITAACAGDSFPFEGKVFDVEKQREFCEYLRDVMCVDRSCSVMCESEHPFTSGFGNKDIRITNHYYPTLPASAVFSAVHESGHGMYMYQCDDSLNNTLSGDGASMAMHESQSRFYENMIARCEAFWEVHYPKFVQTFPEQMKDVSLQTFMRYINHVEYTFVRTEADELTYPLHVMLRYELEKELIDGSLNVRDLPEAWAEKSRSYFGKEPPTDTLGVLQDMHWSGGDIGYFPTYALGSAYAAQIYAAMNRDFDVENSLREGTTRAVNAWLKEKVHRFGASKKPKDILRIATGEDFNPDYYADYLIGKYTKLYL